LIDPKDACAFLEYYSKRFPNCHFYSTFEMGALTGGMTSTPGLSAAESMTETEAPQLAYAAVYPFSLVLVIIAAEIMTLL